MGDEGKAVGRVPPTALLSPGRSAIGVEKEKPTRGAEQPFGNVVYASAGRSPPAPHPQSPGVGPRPLPVAGVHSFSCPLAWPLLRRRRMRATKSTPSRPSSSISSDVKMNGDDEIHPCLTRDGPSHLDMDGAFCARMRSAIAAGLECPPIGVITTPGTKNPKCVPTEPSPLASSLGAMDL